MPNRIQHYLAQLKSQFNDLLFGSDSGRSASAMGHSGRRYWLPGTSTDWESLTGDLWEVPGVMACYGWEKRNLLQSPPQVVRAMNDKTEAVGSHPMLDLWNTPNDRYDAHTLLSGLLLSYKVDGNAYIGIERETPKGLPSELYYIPHFMLRPRVDKATGEIYYEYTFRGRRERIPKEDIVHIRDGMDPRNPLCGIAPLAVAYRDGYLLQQGTTYAAKAMKNSGIIGALATPDPAAVSAGGTFDGEAFVDMYTAKTTGERAGEAMAFDYPLKLQFPNVTPQNMAIDTMLDRPETTVCALWGVPSQVVGLHVGRLAKTYANYAEARESAWEECVVPDGNTIFGQIGRHLLPQLRTEAQAKREICCLNLKDVRPLQPDLDALYTRANQTWEKNLIDRYDWAEMVGRQPDPADKGVFFSDVQVAQQSMILDKQGEIDKQNQPKPVAPGKAVAGFLSAYVEDATYYREQSE